MKKVLQIILPIFIFFIGFNVYAYNMKGWNISNALVYNIDSNNYVYPSGYMSSVVKARWGLDNQTFQSGQYYQVSTSITTRQRAKTSQLRNCAINVNGAYIQAVNYYTKIWSECSDTYCDSQYNITSYFNGENLTNVPVFVQCDLYTDAEFSSINYGYSIAHEPQNNNSDSALISAISNNGQQIVDTNNYNANMNNANRDANTDRIIGELKGQHALASDYIESTKVCELQDNVTLYWKKTESAYENCMLNAQGICVSDNSYVSTDYIRVKPNTKYFIRLQDNASNFIGGNIKIVQYQYEGSPNSYNSVTGGGSIDITVNSTTNYIRVSYSTDRLWIKGTMLQCKSGNQTISDNQKEQTDLLGQIKDTINNTYNTINTTITNILGGIGSTITNIFTWLTDTTIDTSRLNALINRLQDSSPPIFSILTSLKNYVQSFNPNTTCQPVTIPLNTRLNNHNITLPCGTTLFWNRQDVSTFKTWWNLFVGGLLIYSVGLKLIKVIDGAFDPQKDEVGKGLEV